jgi:hypothetical protein
MVTEGIKQKCIVKRIQWGVMTMFEDREYFYFIFEKVIIR